MSVYVVMLGLRVFYFLLPLHLLPAVQAGVRTSGRLVATPSLEACKNRPKHYMDKRTGHYYFFSGKSKFGALKVSCVVKLLVVSHQNTGGLGVEYQPPTK